MQVTSINSLFSSLQKEKENHVRYLHVMLYRTRDNLRATSHRSCMRRGNVVNCLEVYFEQYHILWFASEFFSFNLEPLSLSQNAMTCIINSSKQTSKRGIKRISNGTRKSHIIQNREASVIRTSNKRSRPQLNASRRNT